MPLQSTSECERGDGHCGVPVDIDPVLQLLIVAPLQEIADVIFVYRAWRLDCPIRPVTP